MGILDRVKKERGDIRVQPYAAPGTLRKNVAKIVESHVLVSLIKRTLDAHKIDASDMVENRRHIQAHGSRLANLLNAVDEDTYVFMIDSILAWMIDNHTAVQHNGDWRLCNYEVEIEERLPVRKMNKGLDEKGNRIVEEFINPEKYLMIGFEFVDTRNSADIIYRNGKPAGEDKASKDMRVLTDAILQQQGGASVSGMSREQSDLIEQQKQIIAEQTKKLEELSSKEAENKAEIGELKTMMAQFLQMQMGETTTEVKETSPEKPASKRRVKKDANKK